MLCKKKRPCPCRSFFDCILCQVIVVVRKKTQEYNVDNMKKRTVTCYELQGRWEETMKKVTERKTNGWTDRVYYLTRLGALFGLVLMFFPAVNPGRVAEIINKNLSVFTTAISYQSLTKDASRALRMEWISAGAFRSVQAAAILICISIALIAAMACLSLGNLKMKRVSNWFGLAGGLVMVTGLLGIYLSYQSFLNCVRPDKVNPAETIPVSFFLFAALAAVVLFTSILLIFCQPKAAKNEQMEMETKYKLFLLFLPMALMAFVFCYLPLYGWRYAFFDYSAGQELTSDNFVGLKWFTYLFQNEATRNDLIRVLRNTLIMSGLGIGTSWVAMAFAVFLMEIKSNRYRRFVQFFTTIPNFISWVLVYAIAIAIFNTDGFINGLLTSVTGTAHTTNYLLSNDGTWFKMLAWGLWKGTGWSAIIYIAAISGIDQQLYEAAEIDGAGRFQKMWHITMPGLIPTYCVILLMAVAGILSNGMDQYLVFSNAVNKQSMEVLDLYVYNIGIGNGLIPISTVVGMAKTIVSVVLLFFANGISKMIRGESIM